MDDAKRKPKRRNATTSIGVPPSADGGSFRIRLAKDEIEWLTNEADGKNVSRAAIIRKAIRKMMQENP